MIGWAFLVGLPALTALLLWGARKSAFASGTECACEVGSILSVLAALMAWILLPFIHIDLQGQIVAHKEIGASMQRARDNDWQGFERATLQREVVETNKNLRYYQLIDRYWGPYIPDEIHDVEPVE